MRKTALAGSFAIALVSTFATAQSYPTKPVRIIVPVAPGGGSDFLARAAAPRLTEALGQQFIVENRPGASGVVGTEFGVKSAPDGYTLTVVISNYASYPSLYKLNFDPARDVQPLFQISQGPFLAAVHPSVPARNIKELIALSKRKPGDITYVSTGSGALSHLSVEYFCMLAGVKMTHIPYKGTGPALIDMVSGQTNLIFGSILPTVPHVRSGRLRALAVTTAKRVPVEPNIPTIAESGLPGYEVINWHGVVLPQNTPRPIVDRLNAELNKIFRSPEMIERLQNEGVLPAGGTPEDFGARLNREITLWTKVIRQAGVKAE
jgi:tripartite-type tricarboxylate transporter receptor subunit TctC